MKLYPVKLLPEHTQNRNGRDSVMQKNASDDQNEESGGKVERIDRLGGQCVFFVSVHIDLVISVPALPSTAFSMASMEVITARFPPFRTNSMADRTFGPMDPGGK